MSWLNRKIDSEAPTHALEPSPPLALTNASTTATAGTAVWISKNLSLLVAAGIDRRKVSCLYPPPSPPSQNPSLLDLPRGCLISCVVTKLCKDGTWPFVAVSQFILHVPINAARLRARGRQLTHNNDSKQLSGVRNLFQDISLFSYI